MSHMMISAFSRASGLPVDTVRFYVRRGLLAPDSGSKGGSRPYQIFGPSDLEAARIIRTGQALGLSLNEIATFLDRLDSFQTSPRKLLDYLSEQKGRLEQKIVDLQGLIAYLDAKVARIEESLAQTSPVPHNGGYSSAQTETEAVEWQVAGRSVRRRKSPRNDA
jgi:MerR family transcriptional regulator, copper efflux regulator